MIGVDSGFVYFPLDARISSWNVMNPPLLFVIFRSSVSILLAIIFSVAFGDTIIGYNLLRVPVIISSAFNFFSVILRGLISLMISIAPIISPLSSYNGDTLSCRWPPRPL